MTNKEDASDDDDYASPIQRVQQACDNCRRKKCRCPGERPRCSACKRLRQRCVYAVSIPRTRRAVRGSNPSSSHYPRTGTERRAPDPVPLSTTGTQKNYPASVPDPTGLPEGVRLRGISLYFTYFHNQPYPLMAGMSHRPPQSVAEFPPAIVWYPMLALIVRTCKELLHHQDSASGAGWRAKVSSDLSDAAWRLLTDTYSSMKIDIHFLQGLCLLAQGDFAEGRTQRAQAQVALGIRLAQSLGMMDNPERSDESSIDRHAAVWTLFMLDRVFTGCGVPSPTVSATAYQLPLPQNGPSPPGSTMSSDKEPLQVALHTPMRVRYERVTCILSCNVELLRVWEQVVAVTLRNPAGDEKDASVSLWRDGSLFSKTLSAMAEFEMKLHHHRYARVGPPRRVLQEPELRPYFAAWSFAQICYSGFHCLLHHPFIILLKTRHGREGVPVTFLQKTYRNAVIHSAWVLRLLTEVEDAGITVHDPFIGYMVAIAATIQLELTINRINAVIVEAASQRFRGACNFITRLSTEWPSMENLLGALNRLSVRVRDRQTLNLVESEYDGAIPREEVLPATLDQEDVDLFWTLLDYSAISSSSFDSNGNTAEETLPSMAGQETIPPDVVNHPASDPVLDQTGLGWDLGYGFDNNWAFLGRPWEAYTCIND